MTDAPATTPRQHRQSNEYRASLAPVSSRSFSAATGQRRYWLTRRSFNNLARFLVVLAQQTGSFQLLPPKSRPFTCHNELSLMQMNLLRVMRPNTYRPTLLVISSFPSTNTDLGRKIGRHRCSSSRSREAVRSQQPRGAGRHHVPTKR